MGGGGQPLRYGRIWATCPRDSEPHRKILLPEKIARHGLANDIHGGVLSSKQKTQERKKEQGDGSLARVSPGG